MKKADLFRSKDGIRCLLDDNQKRPCKKCSSFLFSNKLKFGDGTYSFFTALFNHPPDGEVAITARVCGRTFEDRMNSLEGEVLREVEAKRKRIINNKKFGLAWQLIRMSELGGINHRYRIMLRAAKYSRDHRPACACEILNWLSTHEDDMVNCKTNIGRKFSAFKEFLR